MIARSGDAVPVDDPLRFKQTVDGYVAAIEALSTGSYEAPRLGCVDRDYSPCGEDFAVVALRVSDEFYDLDDPDPLIVAAHEEFGIERWGVVHALETRWGPHHTLPVDAYCDWAMTEPPASALLASLNDNGLSDDLQVWKVGDRRVAVGVGQSHREEPVVLFAAVTGSAEGFPV